MIAADAFEPMLILEVEDRQGSRRQAAQEGAGEEVDTEDVAVPRRRQARDPIEGHQGDHEGKDGHEGRRELPGADVEGRILRPVLLQGSAHQHGQAHQDQGEGDHGAQGDKGQAQPEGLAGQELVVQRLGPGAREQHRQGADGQQAGEAGGDQQRGDPLGDSADGHTPLGVHQVFQGHDEEGAQGDGEEEDEPEEPVGPEALGAGLEVGGADAYRAQEQRAPQEGGGSARLAHRASAAFTSASVAF
ncbi:hypothetical protein GALL_552250 [mine drainage metagenome]|uniref:Uncharacterized protein n=1 Tax=mine drainage metagenome TaxID=410659 RepID=A0A1J5NVJ3_9ZZZZ